MMVGQQPTSFDHKATLDHATFSQASQAHADLNGDGIVTDSMKDLSATIAFAWNEGHYRVTLFGRNMTDERSAGGPYIGGLTQAIAWNEPATYGLEFSISL